MPNYKGYFDGTTFYAKSHFNGKQAALGTIPPFYDGSYYFPDDPHVIDGPIKFEFSFELEVE